MRFVKLLAALAGLYLCGSVFADDFDFRGAKLGMTLSELKALPALPQAGSSYPDGTFVSCDPVDDEGAKIGEVSCRRAGDVNDH